MGEALAAGGYCPRCREASCALYLDDRGAGRKICYWWHGMEPALAWRASLPIAGGTAGLLGVAAVATRFASASPGTVACLGASSVVCAVVAGVVAIVNAIASRTPEIRRMAALQRLARRARSPKERLYAMILLSLAKNMTKVERENAAAIIQTVLAAAGGTFERNDFSEDFEPIASGTPDKRLPGRSSSRALPKRYI